MPKLFLLACALLAVFIACGGGADLPTGEWRTWESLQQEYPGDYRPRIVLEADQFLGQGAPAALLVECVANRSREVMTVALVQVGKNRQESGASVSVTVRADGIPIGPPEPWIYVDDEDAEVLFPPVKVRNSIVGLLQEEVAVLEIYGARFVPVGYGEAVKPVEERCG